MTFIRILLLSTRRHSFRLLSYTRRHSFGLLFMQDDIHSDYCYIYNWYLFITAVILYVHGHELRHISIHGTSPCYIPPSTYLAPSSCDRNRPPQSQVARKLSPLFPIAPLFSPPLQIPNPPRVSRTQCAFI